ncbi:MAG: Uma2 family endonuclease [Saprospiraceae bacterium]
MTHSTTALGNPAALQAEGIFAEAVSDGQAPEISREEFLAMEAEPGVKLEWVDGRLIKTDKTMNSNQMYILQNLQDFFETTAAYRQKLGRLHSEFDSYLKSRSIRRPDLGYLTREQIYLAADEKDPLIPAFAIEIISPNERYEEAEQKLRDYINAGIQVVWHIFPKLKTVKVFRPGEKTEECAGDEAVCSAAPVLPDFQMSIAQIFWRPKPGEAAR